MPLISIVTATYNSAATLGDTLNSLERQGIDDLEVILQDGRSSDNTLDIAAKFDFVNIRSEHDQGLYDAMNRGIERTTGSIIGILNSDDFYAADDVLEKVIAMFTDYPEIQAVYGDLEYVHAEDPGITVRRWMAGHNLRKSWRLGWMPPHPTFFVRKDLYDKYGTFKTDLKFAADYELMLRFCYKHKIRTGYIPQVLVKMRTGGVSNNSWRNRLEANREDRKAWEVNGIRCPPLLGLIKPGRKVLQWI